MYVTFGKLRGKRGGDRNINGSGLIQRESRENEFMGYGACIEGTGFQLNCYRGDGGRYILAADLYGDIVIFFKVDSRRLVIASKEMLFHSFVSRKRSPFSVPSFHVGSLEALGVRIGGMMAVRIPIRRCVVVVAAVLECGSRRVCPLRRLSQVPRSSQGNGGFVHGYGVAGGWEGSGGRMGGSIIWVGILVSPGSRWCGLGGGDGVFGLRDARAVLVDLLVELGDLRSSMRWYIFILCALRVSNGERGWWGFVNGAKKKKRERDKGRVPNALKEGGEGKGRWVGRGVF